MSDLSALPPTPRPAREIPRELAVSLLPRLLKGIDIHPDTGCWIRGSRYRNISVTTDGGTVWLQAHRVTYVAVKGAIPENFTIDHLCEVPACCNPLHLSAVTHRENVLRSRTNPTAINARKQECAEGHPLAAPTGKPGRPRGCQICKRKRAKERYRAKRDAAMSGDA